MLIAAGPADGDATKKDLEKMQGDWAAASMVVDGTKLSDDEAQCLFRTVKGDHYTVYHFNKEIGKGALAIDATKKPKTIDATPAGKAKPLRGIYELEGDRLKVCFAPPGKDRPTDFEAKEGSGHTLTVWEREKK
jgi:uncharacterized protein (TIGR03067 family)